MSSLNRCSLTNAYLRSLKYWKSKQKTQRSAMEKQSSSLPLVTSLAPLTCSLKRKILFKLVKNLPMLRCLTRTLDSTKALSSSKWIDGEWSERAQMLSCASNRLILLTKLMIWAQWSTSLCRIKTNQPKIRKVKTMISTQRNNTQIVLLKIRDKVNPRGKSIRVQWEDKISAVVAEVPKHSQPIPRRLLQINKSEIRMIRRRK